MRSDRRALSPVVGIILLLLITVVLAASVYMIATSLLPHAEIRPYVAVTVVSQNNTHATLVVADVSQGNLGLDQFRSVLLLEGLPDRASDISPLASTVRGNVTFTSLDSILNAGDQFLVAIQPNRAYGLRILWANGGDQVGGIDWHT